MKKFAIYAIQRSGSTLLVSMLNQIPNVICHFEVFHPSNIGLRDDKFKKMGVERFTMEKRDNNIHAFYDELFNESPESTVGLKFFPDHNEWALTKTLMDPDIKKIILRRHRPSSYISSLQGRVSNVWMISPAGRDEKDIENIRRKSNKKVYFDRVEFLRYQDKLDYFYQFVENTLKFSGQDALKLTYGELQEPEITDRLCDFLELPRIKVDPSGLPVKQHPGPLTNRLINPDALEEFITEGSDKGFAKLHGMRIETASDYYSPAERKSMREGTFQEDEAACILQTLTKEERFMQWGGGIGYLVSLASDTHHCADKTVVDANPYGCAVISKTLHLNYAQAQVINGLLTNDEAIDQTVPYYLRAPLSQSSLLHQPAYQREVSVPQLNATALLQQKEPTYLVCDLQGQEFTLFPGVDFGTVTTMLVTVKEDPSQNQTKPQLRQILAQKGFQPDDAASRGNVLVFRKPSATDEG